MSSHHHRRRKERTGLEKRMGDFAFLGVQSLVLCVLFALPLYMGGRATFAWSLAGILLLCAVGLWSFALALRGRVTLYPCAGVIFFALLLLLGVIQLSPYVGGLFAPEVTLIAWSNIEAFLATPANILLALAPAVHIEKLLFIGLAALFYLLLCQSFSSERALLLLAFVTFIMTTSYALVGFARYLNNDAYFLWVYLGKNSVASGPFISRNNFAFMQELGTLLGLGLLMMLHSSTKRTFIVRILGRYKFVATLLLALGMTISLLALAFSFSRAGILCTFVGVSLFIGYVFACRVKTTTALIPIALLGVCALVLSSYGTTHLLDRLEFVLSGEDASSLMRIETWKTALEILVLSPWLGVGFGAFRYLGPNYESAWTGNTIAYNVHNDFIELPLSVGIPCALLFFCLLAFFFCRTLFRLVKYRPSSDMPAYHYLGAGAFCGLIAITGHEFVDYGLQQPSNLLLTCAVAFIAGRSAFFVRARAVNQQEDSSWILRRPLYALPVVVSIVCFLLARPYYNAFQAGISLEKIRVMKRMPDIVRTTPPLTLQKSILRHAYAGLGSYNTVDAWENIAQSSYEAAQLELSNWYASKASERLGRTISPERVWLAQYQSLRRELQCEMTPKDRNTIAKLYQESARAYKSLVTFAPTDSIALAGLALATYEAAQWQSSSAEDKAKEVATACQYIDVASDRAKQHESVHKIAIHIYGRELRFGTLSVSLRNSMEKRFWRSAQIVLRGSPSSLTSILPIAWAIRADFSSLEELVPDTIAGQEALYLFWESVAYWYGAEKALVRMQALNNARLEDETPHNMGRRAFLAREKRTKDVVSLRIAEYYLHLYQHQNNAEKIRSTLLQIQILRQKLTNPIVKEIDALIAQGEYLLAEEKAKKNLDNPSIVLRYALIAQAGGRQELFVRTMEELMTRKDFFTGNDLKIYGKLLKALP